MKVLVMAKAPVAGRVKTRLCPPLTPSEAAAVARASLIDTLTAVDCSGANERVLALDGEPGDWLPSGWRVVRQRGGTFAERLEFAWHDCGGPTVQIGMDTPQVTAALLDDALGRLGTHDSALGLTADGGWWGLALRQPASGAFEGVPMSTTRTASHQLRRLRQIGLAPVKLPQLVDVDTWSDAREVASLVPASSFASTVRELDAAAMSGSMW